jgi:hypothetical protein
VLSRPRRIVLLDNRARELSVHGNEGILVKQRGDFVKFLLEVVNPDISDACVYGSVFFEALELRLEGILPAGLSWEAGALVRGACVCTQLYLLPAVGRKRVQRLLAAY